MQPGFSRLVRGAWPGIGLVFLIWLMSIAYGFQYLVMDDPDSHLIYFRIATVPFALLVGLLTWDAVRDGPSMSELPGTSSALGLVLMSISWGLTCYFYSAKLAPLSWIIVAVLVPCLAGATSWRWGSRAAVWSFLAGAFLLIVFLASRLAHDQAGGDMLQIIDFAVRDLLQGNSPFHRYLTVSGKEVLFGYWPGIWLPYIPVIALGLDMRVLNVLLIGLLIALFWKASGGGERGARILGCVLMPLLLSSPLMQMALSGHLWLYWLLSVLCLWLVIRRQYMLAALVFGLCLAARPTALFLAGPIAAYVWTRDGARAAISGGMVTGVVVLALNAPFYLLYGDDFVRASYGALSGIGHQLTHFSVEGILQSIGLSGLGKPLQIVVALAAMAVIVVKRPLAPEKFVMLSGVTYVWEILFANYATRYMYFSGFLLVALGLLIAEVRRSERPEQVDHRLDRVSESGAVRA